MRRLLTRTLGLLLVIAGGCDLADELKGEPCDVDDDCWHTQHCARTDAEQQAALPGVCLAKDVPCSTGEQLGCACVPDDYDKGCTLPAISSTEIAYPAMICDEALLVCVVEPVDGTSEG